MNQSKLDKIERKNQIRKAKEAEALKRRKEAAKREDLEREKRLEQLRALNAELDRRKNREYVEVKPVVVKEKKVRERVVVEDRISKEEQRKLEQRRQKIRNSENKRERKVIRLQGNKVVLININQKVKANFDTYEKTMQFSRGNNYTKILTPEDIISWEIKARTAFVSNTRSIDDPNKNLGRTIGMGFLLGGTGAMASALADRTTENNKKTYTTVDNVYTLDIQIDDEFSPAFISEIDNEQAVAELKSILPKLIGKKKEKISKVDDINVQYDMLIKCKELYDKKIITKAEFEAKKKEILKK